MNLRDTFRNQILWSVGFLLILTSATYAGDKLPGEYRLIEEPEIHTNGKVVLLEFADFYCPHCHMFDNQVGSTLKKEFGDRLEIQMIGFPVMRGKLPTAFEMYEQAKAMGKGPEMKAVLFRSIHQDKIHIFDRSLRSLLIREVGLNVKDFEAGMATGEPYKALEHGKKWGERIGVTHTPTIILNGNIRVDNIGIENLRTLIKGILKQDKAG